MNQRRLSALGITLLAAGISLAGCSSSGSTGSSGSSSAIRVMAEGILTPAAAVGGLAFPYGAQGVQAAAAAINKSGGINGHQIKVDTCDGMGDPNASAACARTAKSNGDIAVVGSFDPVGTPTMLAILHAEGIPMIGGVPGLPTEFSDTDSFQFDPGAVLTGPALVKLWQTQGCTNVINLEPEAAGNAQVFAEQKADAAKVGITVNGELIKLPVADVAPLVSTYLAKKPDCFSYIGDGPTTVKLILGAREQGYQGKFMTATSSLLPPFLATLGAAGNGIYALSSTLLPTSTDPTVTQFRQQMTAYLGKGKVAADLNEFSQDGWSSMQVVKLALAKSTTFTAAELAAKIPTLCNVNIGNVYPHIDFCKAVSSSKALPRVYNDNWQFFVSKNGTYIPTNNKWYDLSASVPK